MGFFSSISKAIYREYDRRMEIDAVSIMLYLTDVTETDHCFAIVPESHNRLVDLDPLEVPADAGVVHGREAVRSWPCRRLQLCRRFPRRNRH